VRLLRRSKETGILAGTVKVPNDQAFGHCLRRIVNRPPSFHDGQPLQRLGDGFFRSFRGPWTLLLDDSKKNTVPGTPLPLEPRSAEPCESSLNPSQGSYNR
jgi:hypothetical protein